MSNRDDEVIVYDDLIEGHLEKWQVDAVKAAVDKAHANGGNVMSNDNSNTDNLGYEIDPELFAAIKGMVEDEKEEQVTNAPEPEFKPADKVDADTDDGFETFGTVFGFRDTGKEDEFPVRVYKAEDWPEEIRDRIPQPDPNYKWSRDQAKALAFAMYVDGPLLAHGPTGTGKTSMIREYCALTNTPFLRVSCNKFMESADFLGCNSVVNENGVPVTKHTDTDTTLAARYGGVLCIDEAFRSPSLMAVQSLLEMPPALVLQDAHGNSRVLYPEAKLKIALTDNTNGTGAEDGRYDAEIQDLSTLDRIRTTLYVDYNPASVEKKIIANKFPRLEETAVHRMVQTANEIRSAFKQGNLQQTMSIRGLLNWAENTDLLADPKRGFELCYREKLNKEDSTLANNIYRQVWG